LSRMACPLCGARDARPFLKRPEMTVLRCPCGMAFAAEDTPPEPYAAPYFERWVKPGIGLVRMKQRTYRAVLSRIAAPGVRTLLDVGCALGWSLDVAREDGYEPSGVELSEHAAAEAGRRHPVKRSTTEYPDGAFDAVTLLDVIEHVRDPVGLLAEIRRLLRPGGRMALTTPDLSSLSARLLGAAWPMVIPEHVAYFDRATIRTALRRAGLRVLRIGPARKSLRADYVAATLASRGDAIGRWGSRIAALFGGLEMGITSGDLCASAVRGA
jgi:SAM-dependent methyltransferase